MPVVVMADIVLKVTPAGALAIIGFLIVAAIAVTIRTGKRRKQKPA
jgi:hypothetical protein